MTIPSAENQPTSTKLSRTSILVAAARAFGSREPDESLRNPDLLAARFIGPAELNLISDHPLSKTREREYAEASQDPAIVFLVWSMLARTRFIDEALRRAVENGAKQIVILGAGFDTRAYRFRALLQECRVIELDAEQTQEYKKQRVRAAMVEVPPNLTYARCNFAGDSLADVLRAAGYETSEPTFYIWEGVCMYLTEESVRQTLRTIATESASGSSLVLDYPNRMGIEIGAKYSGGVGAVAAAWGEPWLFGVPGGTDGREFFRELGFDPGEPLSFSNIERMKRYTQGQDGQVYGAAVFRKIQEEAQARAKAGGGPKQLMPELTDEEQAAWRTGVHWLAELTV
jgi:methyltransferase (TIGR00027 family)